MCRRKDGVLTQLRGCFRPRGKGPAVRPHPVRLVPYPADGMVAKGAYRQSLAVRQASASRIIFLYKERPDCPAHIPRIVDELLHGPVEMLIIAMFHMKKVSLQTDSGKMSR